MPLTIKGVSAPFRSYVLISREQIARNFRSVRSVVGPRVEVACVVKADAYGHGALGRGGEVAGSEFGGRGRPTAGGRHPWRADSGHGRFSGLRRRCGGGIRS